MQYNLTHRGVTLATFDTNNMDFDEANELRCITGKFFRIVQTNPDKLPEIPGYDWRADVERSRERGTGWFQCGRNYGAQHSPGRKHSQRATSWL